VDGEVGVEENAYEIVERPLVKIAQRRELA